MYRDIECVATSVYIWLSLTDCMGVFDEAKYEST